jgi:hypothetical protein
MGQALPTTRTTIHRRRRIRRTQHREYIASTRRHLRLQHRLPTRHLPSLHLQRILQRAPRHRSQWQTRQGPHILPYLNLPARLRISRLHRHTPYLAIAASNTLWSLGLGNAPHAHGRRGPRSRLPQVRPVHRRNRAGRRVPTRPYGNIPL